MSDVGKKAFCLFKEGYNCAQAVLCAFSDEFDIDADTLLKLSSSFGGGMGRLREVCGAVSAMFMIAGLKYGYSDPKDFAAKSTHYKLIQYLANEFKKQNGSIICRELLKEREGQNTLTPETRTEIYYKARSCPEMVESAALIVEKIMKDTDRIAVACDNGIISKKLEECTEFFVYSINENAILKCETIPYNHNGNAAAFLSSINATSVAAGNIEDSSYFNKKEIKTITNAKGMPYAFVQSLVGNF